MSASVADPRLQNWFVNSPYDNDQLTYNSYVNTQPTNTTIHTTNPHHTNMYTHNHNHNTNKIIPTTTHTQTHPKPNQLFGTSIFGDTPDYNTLVAPPPPPPHVQVHIPLPTATLPTLPHVQIKLSCNTDNTRPIHHIKRLLTTLSYAIQEMNQYLDLQENNPSCHAINVKTTNCRNEMVSTLSYYQTYIESNSNTQPLPPPPTHCTSPIPSPPQIDSHCSKVPYSPLNQGLEFPRKQPQLSMTKSEVSDAKLIALDVVGHIIGTPGPIDHQETSSNIANSHTSVNNEQKQHDNMSKLNAYAQPYPTPYTINTLPQPQSTVRTLPTSTDAYLMQQTMNNDTQHTAIQQYYNTLAAQQRAAKQIQNPCNPTQEIEVLTDNDDMAKSNSITTDNNDKEDESQEIMDIIHGDNCDASNHNQSKININQSQPIIKNNLKKMSTNQKICPQKIINISTNQKPPLWSAIAKQIVKPQLPPVVVAHDHDEKSPESGNGNVRFNNGGYWNVRHRNYNGSVSSTSSGGNNNNGVTPSPSPPNNGNRSVRRGCGGKERCRVFVSNLPPNVTDHDIRNAFAHCGDIANTVWFPSRTDGKFYGSGLITFCDGFGSREALRLNQQNVLGRIIRCEYSSCQDPVKVKPPGCRTIYLNNVPRDAQEGRIRQVFKHCGKIKRVRFHERDTKRTGGAFVEFENTVSCDKALDLHGKIVDHHPLYVDYQRY